MLVFSPFIVKLKYMSTDKRTTVWHHWNDTLMYQWHITMTWLSFALYGICSIFISVFKDVNMIKWFEAEEEFRKQHSLSNSRVSFLFLQVSQAKSYSYGLRRRNVHILCRQTVSSHLYSCCTHDTAFAFFISPRSLQGPAWYFLQNQRQILTWLLLFYVPR